MSEKLQENPGQNRSAIDRDALGPLPKKIMKSRTFVASNGRAQER